MVFTQKIRLLLGAKIYHGCAAMKWVEKKTGTTAAFRDGLFITCQLRSHLPAGEELWCLACAWVHMRMFL